MKVFYRMLKISIIILSIYIITCIVGIFNSEINRNYVKNESINFVNNVIISFLNRELTAYGKNFDGKRIVSIDNIISSKKSVNSILDNCFYSLYACVDEYELEEVYNITVNADTVADEVIYGGEVVKNTVIDSVASLNSYTISDEALKSNNEIINTLKKNQDFNYLINNFYIVDATTSVTNDMLNLNTLLSKDMTIKNDNSKPQILIYHTHSTEKFIDSREGVEEDTIVGVGSYLAQILKDEYGYNVIHDKKSYDVINGSWNRQSYDTALTSLKQQLSQNPSIEVMIDLHRNAGAQKVVTEINGVKTAQVMLFNGTTRSKTGFRENIKNENLMGNFSFSLQLKLNAMTKYPDFIKKIYLKGYRYNLHLLEKSALIEVGNDKNTVSEAKNAMVPLAKVLADVIK